MELENQQRRRLKAPPNPTKDAAAKLTEPAAISFRVLGFECGDLAPTKQYAVCTAVLFFFTLLYGYLQELVSIHIFARDYGLFVTLLQFLGYTFFAFLQWASRDGTANKMPVVYWVVLSVLQAAMQGLSNISMQYLNYPAKVLFKSSRVIPTMVFGVVFYGKRHTRRECASVFVLVFGLMVFMAADAHMSPTFDPVGVVFISASLLVDAAIINIQEHIFGAFQADEEEMVFVSFAGGSVILLAITLVSGELVEGVAYMNTHKSYSAAASASVIVVFAACGFCGVSCVAVLTKRFGAVTAVLTTTARKALTLLLSFVFFPKPFAFGHFMGIMLFVSGLAMRSIGKSAPHNLAAGNQGKNLSDLSDEEAGSKAVVDTAGKR